MSICIPFAPTWAGSSYSTTLLALHFSSFSTVDFIPQPSPPSSESAVSRFFFLSQCGASNGTENFGLGLKTKGGRERDRIQGRTARRPLCPDALVGNLNHIVSHAYAQCGAHVMSRPDCSDDRSVSTSPDGADRGPVCKWNRRATLGCAAVKRDFNWTQAGNAFPLHYGWPQCVGLDYLRNLQYKATTPGSSDEGCSCFTNSNATLSLRRT